MSACSAPGSHRHRRRQPAVHERLEMLGGGGRDVAHLHAAMLGDVARRVVGSGVHGHVMSSVTSRRSDLLDVVLDTADRGRNAPLPDERDACRSHAARCRIVLAAAAYMAPIRSRCRCGAKLGDDRLHAPGRASRTRARVGDDRGGAQPPVRPDRSRARGRPSRRARSAPACHPARSPRPARRARAPRARPSAGSRTSARAPRRRRPQASAAAPPPCRRGRGSARAPVRPSPRATRSDRLLRTRARDVERRSVDRSDRADGDVDALLRGEPARDEHAAPGRRSSSECPWSR